MTASLTGLGPILEVPSAWPEGLPPEILSAIDLPTPFLAGDLRMVADRFQRFARALPRVRAHYAVKCNSAPEVLRTAAAEGAGFEIASLGELRMLQAIGVDPADVLYSNTVKPASHIAEAAEAGLWRFAADSEGELHKIARVAPGSAVYIRVRVDDSGSVFPLSRKFGAEAHHARALLQEAKRIGLQPYGLTFHVGSQCAATSAWRQAIASAGRIMRNLQPDGIRLRDARPRRRVPGPLRRRRFPPSSRSARSSSPRSTSCSPTSRCSIVAEPGRHMVAETAVMVASVLGREERAGEEWLYLDVGAYNGLMETQQTVGQWRFPLWSSRADHGVVEQVPYTITGPSCDSSDTMFYGASLPVTMSEGDRLFIASAGAYTLSYASSFNGFPPPATYFLGC